MKMFKTNSTAVSEKPSMTRKRPPISITHPGKKETVSHPSYTCQISVSEPSASVEVSIDNGAWQPCREALGLWWYDWVGYHASEHNIVARLTRLDGSKDVSEPRIFEVSLY